jgi:hypothetical protein
LSKEDTAVSAFTTLFPFGKGGKPWEQVLLRVIIAMQYFSNLGMQFPRAQQAQHLVPMPVALAVLIKTSS